ncbi:alpha/beta fold hydrolase [Cytobacillus massiliigabonensis]|uniref:alpha/beta fold hydrolase n=1 Tax=Cytobacillus massiliigabonensis TaxID=1871011 RepID=UPI000C84FAD6|nr:alpha/beta hydrolase [Cytobacillus massiliigabonensis]
MNYKIFGHTKSAVTILAIPALGERKEFYIPLAKQLNDFRWIVCDLPGHNNYETKDMTINSYVNNLKDLLDSLDVTKVHLVGTSIGATIIQAFYQKYNKVVKSLFLLDGGYYFLGERQGTQEEMTPQKIEKYEDIRDAVHDFTYSIEGLRKQNYEQFEHYFLENYIEDSGYYKHHCDVDSYNALSKEVDSINYCLKEQPDIPLILLLAENNLDEFSKKKVKEFQARYPLAKVQIINNGHHYLPLTHTAEIKEFIQLYIS